MKNDDGQNATLRRVAPGHLSTEMRAWWRGVVREFVPDESQIKLITLAGEAWDMGCKARLTVAEHGLTFIDKSGQPKERPEVKTYKDATAAFSRLIRQLELDVTPPEKDL